MLVLAASVTLVLTAACGSGQGTGPAVAQGTGPGIVHRSSSGGGQQSGNRSTGNAFSLAFARCMRAHGVPNFPDPNGQVGQLGPGSGVDPASQPYQAAINGPCRSLAPAGWVSSGQVSNGS
jgi:hypothetical protein